MKYLAYLLMILTVVIGCAQTVTVKEQAPLSQLAPLIDNTTVALVNDHVYCAGVWISSSLILTAGHCVYYGTLPEGNEDDGSWNPVGANTSYITYSDQSTQYPAKVIAFDPDHDLGLLRASGVSSFATLRPDHPWTVLSTSPEPKQGDRCFTVGHPSGFVWSFSSGDISAIRFMEGATSDQSLWVIQTSAYTYFGNSGGGLWDTEGRLIGIASFLHRGSRYGFFVHIDHVNSFAAPYL